MIDTHHRWNMSFKPAVLGLVFSVVLTAAAFRIVTHHHLANLALIATVVILGVIQAILQLIFFLHIGLESKPHWNLKLTLYMTMIIFILVGGSVWIMHHLGYNTMPPTDTLENMW
jgi:cytochrome o ubiquinol oxidase operon protein cyoD